MGRNKWTPEQQQAISARAGTLLVSAAAGSGKTSVLVQRVIEYITGEEDPCGIDELLVVTLSLIHISFKYIKRRHEYCRSPSPSHI